MHPVSATPIWGGFDKAVPRAVSVERTAYSVQRPSRSQVTAVGTLCEPVSFQPIKYYPILFRFRY